MTNLIINRVNFVLSDKSPNLYLSKKDDFLFRIQLLHLKLRFTGEYQNADFLKWVKDIADDEYIYYGFSELIGDDYFQALSGQYPFFKFKHKFIREQLIIFLKQEGFFVEPNPIGCDLKIYEKTSDFNLEWGTYRRFDFTIHSGKKHEIAFNVGSENTLISNAAQTIQSEESINFIDSKDDCIRHIKTDKTIECRIVANSLKRKELIQNNTPKKLNYKHLYDQMMSLYKDHLLKISTESFKIEAGGLKNVDVRDLSKVYINENLMLFGKDRTDINAVTGMRDYGIYKPSPKARDIKFIFVYENSQDANQLYLHLKNGLKHYPGLWSYVGIPVRLSDLKIQYNGSDDLKSKIDVFITDNLPNGTYSDLFTIVISPFSNLDKEDVEEGDDPMYYSIKRKFLEKGISTQFIQDKNIHSGSFHYFLPNISIGILAKLGGVPWRLKSKKRDELVIGFNQKIIGKDRYIGSAVFFSNDGELGKTFGFPESNSETILIQNLKSAIEQYIVQKDSPPERLVIHYYKPNSRKEQESIEHLIQKEFRLNIPFAIVEINDSKSQMDICFDTDYSMGMPESGTYVRVNKLEYLLFNNTRYQKNPLRSVTEELPIKVAIHFADTGGFSHKELISQVYEFSRLYWKGLKQRSQPATTIYAKLIAEFAGHSGGVLPKNETVNSSPWFL